MAYEIIYVCNSINNKNVRDGELKILRKYEDKLYFEFGESETNIKKRFYKDLETLNKDFEELSKLKENEEKVFTEEKIIRRPVIVEEEKNYSVDKGTEQKNKISEKKNKLL
jgi:arsenate reductase-like glutaredoxin family protein